jgi:hypothetical protein
MAVCDQNSSICCRNGAGGIDGTLEGEIRPRAEDCGGFFGVTGLYTGGAFRGDDALGSLAESVRIQFLIEKHTMRGMPHCRYKSSLVD